MVKQNAARAVNWRQAAAEVGLIAVGVLFALGVDSWWDEKTERSAEIEYLQSLQTDFKGNKLSLAEHIQGEWELIELGQQIHKHISSEFADISLTEMNSLIGRFYWLYDWEPNTGTYDEMVASGRLLYLRNGELRELLSRYEHHLETIKRVEQEEWTNWRTEQSPFLRRNLNFSKLGWVSNYDPEFPFDVDLSQLHSKEFFNLVASWMAAHHDVIINYVHAVELGDEILELIDDELRVVSSR